MRRVLLVLFLLTTVLVPVAAAQEGQPGVLLIMDASGSMNREVGGGVTLLDEAKAGLREIVRRLPPGANVGLRVYGHRTPNDDKAAGCVDTELVVPVGPIDPVAMTEAIDAFDASGWTPIGLLLHEAVADLGDAGGTIVLVSDGVDTCAPPDPCEVALQLAADGYITRIHTVGLFLQDQAAVEQLQCIADASGGTFSGIDSVEGLVDGLSGVVTGAVEDSGSPFIVGGLSRQLATVLPWSPHGEDSTPEDWHSALAQGVMRSGETRWFAVDVDREGQQLSANANLGVDWLRVDAGDVLEIQIFDATGEPIGEEHVVAGITVEMPRRLVLSEWGAWMPNVTDWSGPSANAVTDPGSMFPSWEPDASWFEGTVNRFEDAGLNGGIYHLWKRWNQGMPLSPGRYYIAVTWDSEVDQGADIGMHAVMYPMETEYDEWRVGRPSPPVVIDAGEASPFAVELEPWSDGALTDLLGTPTHGVEIWSALQVGEPRSYTIELNAGEWLIAGWDLEFSRWQDEWELDIGLEGPAGTVPEALIAERQGPVLKMMGNRAFEIEATGEYTLEASLLSADGSSDSAIALAIFVLSEPPATRPLPQIALRSIDAGLRSVARDFGGLDG